jgi:two-component system CAI-1 autoinducer sensor kinase/phosphatase CqsS
MLLVNSAEKPLADPKIECFSATECIEEAIDRYPFNNQHERNLIQARTNHKFEIAAPRLLVVHVLFNLIKNGLYYVQRTDNGKLEITTQGDSQANQIIVHDTGIGIPTHVQSHIFERFYTTSTTGQGAGMGLSFCKMVMDAIGGKISCESVEGEYTTFTLTFPAVELVSK